MLEVGRRSVDQGAQHQVVVEEPDQYPGAEIIVQLNSSAPIGGQIRSIGMLLRITHPGISPQLVASVASAKRCSVCDMDIHSMITAAHHL